MASDLPYMPLYVGDYFKDTRHLSTEEHGAYLLLLMEYWNRGAPLPDDDRALARLAGLSLKRWKTLRAEIASFFFCDGVTWSHKRIEADLMHARQKIEKARKAGFASAKARQKKARRSSNGRSTDVQRTLRSSSNGRATISESEYTPLTPQDRADATDPSVKGRGRSQADDGDGQAIGDLLKRLPNGKKD